MPGGHRSLGYKESGFSSEAQRKTGEMLPPDGGARTHLAKRLTSSEPRERSEAVRLLSNNTEVMAELANTSGHPDVRMAAMSFIKEREALADIARYCHFKDSREAAVRSLAGSEEGLIEVACSSLFRDSREAAIAAVGEEGRAEVAVRARDPAARRAALESLGSQRSLLLIATESFSPSTRARAVRRLGDDVDSLCAIASGGKHPDSRRAALRLLSPHLGSLGPEILSDVASLSPSAEDRLAAVARLKGDVQALRRVLNRTSSASVRRAARRLLSEMAAMIDDPMLLLDIALFAPGRDGRRTAIGKLWADPEALLEIALRSRHRDSRDSALRRLSGDQDMLRRIRRSSSHADTRAKAHSLLCRGKELERSLERMLSRT